jgi:hypothetical protein
MKLKKKVNLIEAKKNKKMSKKMPTLAKLSDKAFDDLISEV